MGNPGRSRAEAARSRWPTVEPPWLAFYQRALRMALAQLHDEDAASEVLQVACLAALEHSPEDARSLEAWFLAVVRNKIRDHIKPRRAELKDFEALDALQQKPGDGRSSVTPQNLEKVLSVLPSEERAAVRMHYVEELSAEEIGLVMKPQASAATVRSWISRGRSKLLKYYGREKLLELLSPDSLVDNR